MARKAHHNPGEITIGSLQDPDCIFCPSNDNPCGAIEIECGQTLTVNEEFITYSGNGTPSCGDNGDYINDLFYSFVANPGWSYSVTVNGDNYDAVLALYTGTCLNIEEQFCTDDGSGIGIAETIEFSLSAAAEPTIMYIRTYHNDFSFPFPIPDLYTDAQFELSISCTSPNDDPCDAILIDCNSYVVGSSSGATSSGVVAGEFSCSAPVLHDVFYKFNAEPNIDYTANVYGANYDGVLALYTGSCNNLTEIGCADNEISTGLSESITFSASFPQTIYIRTTDFYGGGGDFTVWVDCSSNNQTPCQATTMVCGQTVTGSTVDGFASSVDPPTCAAGSLKDVFFEFEAVPGKTYVAVVNGDNYDGVIAAYSGFCGGLDLNELACADNYFYPGEEESISFTVDQPTTVLIRTYDYLTSGGEFTLTLNCTINGDTPCEAIPIICGETLIGATQEATHSGLDFPSCSERDNGDIFYTFEGLEETEYTLTMNGVNIDGILTAYIGSCDGSLVELACADNGLNDGLEETITFSLGENATVFIRVMDWHESGGDFEISLSCPTTYDCPDLSLNIGDACDDGNPNTNNDSVNSECACIGSIIPSNDLCNYALEIYVNEPSGCPAVQTIGTTMGASDETGAFSCDGGDSEWPDVFYTFDSGQNQQIIWNIDEITQTDLVVSVSPSCQGAPIACETGTSNHIFSVEPYTEYIVRVAPNLSYGEAGTFSICFEGVYDCPELEAYIGDTCNDGNPATSNDTVNASCNCEGTISNIPDNPCDAITMECGQTLSGSTEGATIGTLGNPNCYGIGGSLEDVFYIFSAFPGFEYQVLVNGANYDGTIIAYSGICTALTEVICSSDPIGDGVEEEINFSVEVATNVFIRTYDYETSQGSFNITLNCTEAYDCPALSLNIGDACNDNDLSTYADMITADCDCVGTSIYDCIELSANIGDPCNDGNPETVDDTINASCECEGTIIYDCPALSLNIGDACNDNDLSTYADMITADCDCVGTSIYDCIEFSANIGDPCNDGNPETVDDTINASCECEGTIIYDCPALSLNIGDACNDNDLSTYADMITADCNCVGTSIYDCIELSANIGDPCNDGNPETVDDTINASCECEGIIIYDCPALSLNIGDACNDNDLSTYADMITADCNCVGTSIYDCIELSANIGDPCNDGNPETVDDTINASCECEGTIIYDCPALSLNIGDACNDNDLSTYADMITADCNCVGTSIYDCIELSANIGDPCNDGNPETIDDTINASCECEGTIVYDCPALSLNIGDACNDNDLSTYADMITADCNCVGTSIYDCIELSADVGDPCNDGNPETVDDTINASCECEGTIIYDCPALSLNIGDACNDNDLSTYADMITADCNCVGTSIYDCIELSANIGDPCNDGNPETVDDTINASCECEGTIIYDCPALSLNIGDACNDNDLSTYADMITVDCNCVGTSIYDCIELSADVGDSCDDGDATTINDEVQANCTCEGEPAGDASLNGTSDWNTNCSSRPMEIALYNAGTSTHIATLGFDINADGTFATSMDYLGTFDIYIKIDGYLRKGFYNYAMVVGTNSIDVGELTTGELNGDDGVNIADVSVVNAAFGSEVGDANYNLLADMNCDGGVNIVDVSILNANFGLVGVILP